MPIRRRTFALRVTALYVVLAVAWIGLGDALVLRFASDVLEAHRYQLFKGWLFVALSGAFIFWLARLTRHRWFEAQTRLRDTQAEFETTERVAGVGHWVMDSDAGILRWSPEMFRIFGLAGEAAPSFEESMGQVHPEDRDAVLAAGAALDASGEALNVTHRIVQPNGETRWVVLRGEVVPGIDGGKQVTGTVQDITELKAAEADLREAHEQLDALAAHVQILREEERQRLAMDIHDVVGAGLAAVRMSMIRLGTDLRERPNEQQRVASMEQDVDRLIGTVRQLAADLRPAGLDELGLVASLEVLIDDWSRRCDCTVELVAEEDAAAGMPADRSIHVYRIVQEALTNVLRHAGATNVLVTLGADNGRLDVLIRDNGRGIGTAARREPTFGLANMRQRAAMLGGQVAIGDAPGGGTDVEVSIPLAAAT